jgi:TIR domain
LRRSRVFGVLSIARSSSLIWSARLVSSVLSYHSPDRECALALKAAIEQAQPGSEVFVDQTGLRYGHLWQPALFDAIAKSMAFIILVSNGRLVPNWQKVASSPHRWILSLVGATGRGAEPST